MQRMQDCNCENTPMDNPLPETPTKTTGKHNFGQIYMKFKQKPANLTTLSIDPRKLTQITFFFWEIPPTLQHQNKNEIKNQMKERTGEVEGNAGDSLLSSSQTSIREESLPLPLSLTLSLSFSFSPPVALTVARLRY